MCSNDTGQDSFYSKNQEQQKEWCTGDDDNLISQAYDDFVMGIDEISMVMGHHTDQKAIPVSAFDDPHSTCNEKLDEEELITVADLVGCSSAWPHNKSISAHDDPHSTCNEKLDDEELITLADLVGCCSAWPHNKLPDLPDNPDIDKELDSMAVRPLKELALNAANIFIENETYDIPESSTIAVIIIMEIFDRALKLTTQVKRWKKSNPASWKVNIAKKRRAEGLPYIIKNKVRPAKSPKHVNCKCQNKCSEKINEATRIYICRKYWRLDYIRQKNFLLASMDIKKPKTVSLERKRDTKRTYTTRCFFKVGDVKIYVCQNFFCKTLSISQSVIQNAVSNRDEIGQFNQDIDPRGRCEPTNKTPLEKVENVRNHIRSFPSMESHYIRKESKRQYLDSKLSIGKMYQLYVEECKNHNRDPVSEITYRRIFGTDFNLGFFQPKKDQCLICTRYARGDAENNQELEEDYQSHITRKEASNMEKAQDKERASKEKEFVSVSFDLQAILQIPSGDIGLLYYTRKLTVYNLTIYESALPNQAYCFTWSECNGKKGSCEIGTALLYYLSTCIPNHVKEVSLFSDTCGGQNRNKNIAAILLWAVQKIEHLSMIEQKFLESGHSYMEADSMHSSIETAQKNTSVYSISDWINIFKRARSKTTYKKDNKKVVKEPYRVKEFKYHEFKNIKDLSDKILINTNKDEQGQQVKWLKIKRLRYIKGDNKIFFNYDMSETFSAIDVTKKFGKKDCVAVAEIHQHGYGTRNKNKNSLQNSPAPSASTSRPESENYFPCELLQLYQTPLKISAAKKKDLLQLCEKGVIPEEFHGWYKDLNADDGCRDRLPDCTVSDEDPPSDEF